MATTADPRLADLLADVTQRARNVPGLDEVVEDAGRQRLGAYYLYSGQIAGVISGEDLRPAGWPEQFAEPMRRLGLTRLAPRTGRGLDAELTPAEQATRHSQKRQQEFADLLVELINRGAFGPICRDADSVRLAQQEKETDSLELIKDGRVVGKCAVKDHWELVAQQLASAPSGSLPAAAPTQPTTARRLENSGTAHAVSLGITLAVHVHPLGAAAGLGTRLVESRVQANRSQADALRNVGQDLRDLL